MRIQSNRQHGTPHSGVQDGSTDSYRHATATDRATYRPAKRKPLPSDEYGLWCAGLAPSVLSGRCPCLGRSIHSFIRHTEAEAEPTEPCVRYEYPAGNHNYSPQTQSRRTSHSRPRTRRARRGARGARPSSRERRLRMSYEACICRLLNLSRFKKKIVSV